MWNNSFKQRFNSRRICKSKKGKCSSSKICELNHTQSNVQITGGVKNLASALQGKPMKEGDIIAVVKPGVAKKKESLGGPLDEIQKMMGDFSQHLQYL